MVKTKTNINKDLLATFIDAGIKKFIEERYKQFIEDLRKDMDKELAGITLYIMENIELQKTGDVLTIVLRTK